MSPTSYGKIISISNELKFKIKNDSGEVTIAYLGLNPLPSEMLTFAKEIRSSLKGKRVAYHIGPPINNKDLITQMTIKAFNGEVGFDVYCKIFQNERLRISENLQSYYYLNMIICVLLVFFFIFTDQPKESSLTKYTMIAPILIHFLYSVTSSFLSKSKNLENHTLRLLTILAVVQILREFTI